MLHLYYFESLLEQHGIFHGYKIGLRMAGILIKTMIESALNTMRSLILDNSFEI